MRHAHICRLRNLLLAAQEMLEATAEMPLSRNLNLAVLKIEEAIDWALEDTESAERQVEPAEPKVVTLRPLLH